MAGETRGWASRLPLPLARAFGRDVDRAPDRPRTHPSADAPTLSHDEQIEEARRAAYDCLERGDFDGAEKVVRAVMERTSRPRKIAALLAEVTGAILAAGREPSLLLQAYGAQLRVADMALRNGRPAVAAEAFAKALELAFDRNVHYDATTSPLARDPQGFAEPLRVSDFVRAVRAPRGRATMTPEPGRAERRTESGAALRVLVATRGNANFLGEMTQMLEAHPAVDHRFVDFSDTRQLSRGIFKTAQVAEDILTGKHGMGRRVEDALRPHLDGTDILFVEWCSALAVLVGLVDPRETRVVIRLHSYEAFSHWPHLLDLSRVDDMVFVSEHLRDLAVDAVPGLREEHAPRLHVLPLAKDLRPYVRPKADDARFHLGLVGWGSVAKDPLWALEVLRLVREQDERYRLLLIGSDFAGDSSPAAARYAERLRAEMAELETVGAVRRVGQTDDVPAALTEVGVILSTSVRESFHAAVVEGAASGAVPVVRDWPFFAGRATGARTLYPTDWVVESPEEAARRILDVTSDAGTWREAGERTTAHALSTWDWEVVRPGYERLFLG